MREKRTKDVNPVADALTGPERGLALAVVVLNVALAVALAQRARFPRSPVDGSEGGDRAQAEHIPAEAPRLAHAGERAPR